MRQATNTAIGIDIAIIQAKFKYKNSRTTPIGSPLPRRRSTDLIKKFDRRMNVTTPIEKKNGKSSSL